MKKINQELLIAFLVFVAVCLLLTRSLSLCFIQIQLYEDFAKSRAKVSVDDTISTASVHEEEDKPKLKATGHVFQVSHHRGGDVATSMFKGTFE